ncbi:hypothetical protein K9N68_39210 (plasmid) [Kovacikia minuta CCNUW1]|uniref:DUF6745 domain-containing protein n=1 Tax=Kovacikia minuta TaxID=2931930 RepID=UPI001CCC83D3|nr:hypothetical protein [Kovacikia minuta]UBF30173.1 hypothetical protein K9N68_39210 [Kovacikia minuta CCNUW1]
MNNRFSNLNPEQEKLIPVYKDRWKQFTCSTAKVNRQKASNALKEAYTLIGEQQPDVFFFDSPYAALEAIQHEFWERVEDELAGDSRMLLKVFTDLIKYPILTLITTDSLADYLWQSLWEPLYQDMTSYHEVIEAATYREDILDYESLGIEDWVPYGSFFDFCISVMNYNELAQEEWKVFQALSSELYKVYLYQGICIASDRPIKINFDLRGRIHAENDEPAIQFADGFSLYAHHGKYVHHEIITLS